jgi:heme/copper-type cytochrome/quinol oxidase subunit 4
MHSRTVSELSERSAMSNEMQGRTTGFALILNLVLLPLVIQIYYSLPMWLFRYVHVFFFCLDDGGVIYC